MSRFSPHVSSFLSRATPVVCVVVALVALTACDSGGGDPTETSPLQIGFATATVSSPSSAGWIAKSAPDSMTISGPNGTLTVTDIRFVVEAFELEGENDSLSVTVPPASVDLPLDTSAFTPAGTFDIPPATYLKFEFEVDDLEADDDDGPNADPELRALLSELRNEFPNWPADASMVAVGTFTPTDGSPRPFTTFIETEIEIERPLTPPLEVTGDGTSRSLTVRMAPGLWFRTSGGEIRDLSQHASADTLLEIENEFETGVLDVEIDGEG